MATEDTEIKKLELQVRLAELENERLRLLASTPKTAIGKKGSIHQLSLVKASDPWRPLMEQYARDRQQISIPDLIAELFDVPHARQSRQDYQRVAEILRSMGYERHRQRQGDGSCRRYWFAPKGHEWGRLPFSTNYGWRLG